MKNMQDSLLATRKDDLTISALGDEVLVYDPDGRRASCLNSFAAGVLALCDGHRSAYDITRDLPLEDVDERMVSLALADLQKAELLQDGFPVAPNAYARTNRRDLLRRLGVGAAVAIPIVAGITTPAHASHPEGTSCVGEGGVCEGDPTPVCCSGSCDNGFCAPGAHPD